MNHFFESFTCSPTEVGLHVKDKNWATFRQCQAPRLPKNLATVVVDGIVASVYCGVVVECACCQRRRSLSTVGGTHSGQSTHHYCPPLM